MDDIVVETPLTPEEIEENFKSFDFFSSLKEGLEAAIAYENGKPLPGTIVKEYILSDVDGSVIDIQKTVY